MSTEYKDTRICIISVYFGVLPNYFGLWLRSVKFNSNIDFLMFSDQTIQEIPNNLKIVNCNLHQLKDRIENKLGYLISLDKPYKCCDFRPAFGLIFDDYLVNYDYWGYCDFDMIFGDLKSFFEKYHLSQYDRFLPMGHLGLYKNTIINNKRFMTMINDCVDYRQVFTDYHNYAFDEQGSRIIYEKCGYSFFRQRIFADISKIYKRFRLALKDKNYNNQVFFWDRGKIFRAFIVYDEIRYEEFIYIHFKERGLLPIHGACLDSKMFYITNRGFFASEDDYVSENDIIQYNHFYGRFYEFSERLFFELGRFIISLKSKLKRILKTKEIVR